MNIINVIGKYRDGEWFKRSTSGIKVITVHHTATPHRTFNNDTNLFNSIKRTHKKHGWPGISYHFLITQAGKVYQLNDYTDITWHDKENVDSLAVCLEGYFHPPYFDKPTVKQLVALKALLDHLCTEKPEFPADQDDVIGHKERVNTNCPGSELQPYILEYKSKSGKVNWEEVEEVANCDKYKADIRELESRLDKKGDEITKLEQDIHKIKEEKKQALEINTGLNNRVGTLSNEVITLKTALNSRENSKPFYESKTFWVNGLAGLGVLLQSKYGFILNAEFQLFVLGVINLALRSATNKHINWDLSTLKPKQ